MLIEFSALDTMVVAIVLIMIGKLSFDRHFVIFYYQKINYFIMMYTVF